MSRAMTGAWQGLGQGIARAGEMAYGAHLSERGEQRRTELQAKLRGEERAEDRAHQSTMADKASADAESRIRLQAALQKENVQETRDTWQDEYDADGNRIGQRSSSGRLEMFPPVKSSMDPGLKVQLDEVQNQADHLRKMERDIRTKKTDEFGNVLVDDNNREEILQEIRERMQATASEFNRLLGKTKATPAESRILSDAMTLPEEDRAEFLADLQGSGKAESSLLAAVQALWAPNRAAADEAPAAPTATGGGLIEEAQGASAPAPTPAPVPTPEPAPAPAPEPQPAPANPENMTPAQMQQAIIERSRSQGQNNFERSAKDAQVVVENLLVSGRVSKMDKNAQAAFLKTYGRYFPAMPDEVVEQLRATFGEQAVNQYLN